MTNLINPSEFEVISMRESTHDYYLRRMREERMKYSSPEEEKISNHLGREQAEAAAFQPVKSYDELDRLTEENRLLKRNIYKVFIQRISLGFQKTIYILTILRKNSLIYETFY